MWVQMCLKCREATKTTVGHYSFVNITKKVILFLKHLQLNHIHGNDETLASVQSIVD